MALDRRTTLRCRLGSARRNARSPKRPDGETGRKALPILRRGLGLDRPIKVVPKGADTTAEETSDGTASEPAASAEPPPIADADYGLIADPPGSTRSGKPSRPGCFPANRICSHNSQKRTNGGGGIRTLD